MRLFYRLAIEFRSRGATGFMRFIALRLLQSRGDILFEKQLGIVSNSLRDPNPGDIFHVNKNTLGSATTKLVEQAVLTESNHAYREELLNDGQLFAVKNGQSQVTCYGFVIYESFYKRILGEAHAVPMISNCFTFPEHRGQGLYPRILRAVCHSLSAEGQRRVIVTCAIDNLASIRGIEKAGFKHVKTIHTLVLFARWIAWQKCVEPSRSDT